MSPIEKRNILREMAAAGLLWTGAQHEALSTPPTLAIQRRLGRAPWVPTPPWGVIWWGDR